MCPLAPRGLQNRCQGGWAIHSTPFGHQLVAHNIWLRSKLDATGVKLTGDRPKHTAAVSNKHRESRGARNGCVRDGLAEAYLYAFEAHSDAEPCEWRE